ncbi:MarR family winged helix-turn-helix transcriptional regulator [Antarcticirhabdus aurantiaca]|uniref:MarR family winged helix-turn-helix transcriptional regulator n=1 Tax=Antarcticirhabdus aurantiaca TaxID=2606717 RepID=UPI00131E53A8|nr:MarR family winged helix-turn-helix transcriptional regulator [Antarcticirhabdus aurantiaca]
MSTEGQPRGTDRATGREAEGVDDEERKPAFPLEGSVGYQIRMANRATQRYLQARIEPHGVALGMWYFLRALWQEDGLTQRELSERVGTMEPTTLHAISGMERAGIVKRKRNKQDKRKVNVFLTVKGQALREELLPIAMGVVDTATSGLSDEERRTFLETLLRVRRNLDDDTLPR